MDTRKHFDANMFHPGFGGFLNSVSLAASFAGSQRAAPQIAPTFAVANATPPLPPTDNTAAIIKSAALLSAVVGSVSETPLNFVEVAFRNFQIHKYQPGDIKPSFTIEGMKVGWHIAYPKGIKAAFFNGLAANITQRIFQRTFSFGMQPVIKNYLTDHYGKQLDAQYGHQKRLIGIQMASGILIAPLSVSLLPFDYVKVRKQLLDPRPARQIIFEDRLTSFRGAMVFGGRDMLAFSAFFPIVEATKIFVFNAKEGEQLSPGKVLFSSFLGGIGATIVSNPHDVVKTRIQHKNTLLTGRQVSWDIYKNEGIRAFAQGMPVRFFHVVPRLVIVNSVVTHAKPLIEQGLFKLTGRKQPTPSVAQPQNVTPTPTSTRKP